MSEPHVTVVMATYNGARYLPAQLDSLLAQTHANWSLVVSDDGSTDATLALLRAFDRAHPGRKLRLLRGPCTGSAAQNFMSVLTWHHLPSGMIALADQDDVWLPGKLARAVSHLQNSPEHLPTIYASQSLLTDRNLVPLRQKTPRQTVPCFRNALVQNIFSGHTLALNGSAARLVQRAGNSGHIAFHDWWIYQLIAGAGGQCMLDPAQMVLYRQHGSNAFGAAHGIFGTFKRLHHLARNDYSRWLSGHWRALRDVAEYLTPDARDLIRDLLSDHPAREPRAAQFRRLRLHRASPRGTTALHLAARLGFA